MRRLNKEVDLIINDKTKFIYTFNIALLSDISQQIYNKEFLYHLTRISCCTCYCFKKTKQFKV